MDKYTKVIDMVNSGELCPPDHQSGVIVVRDWCKSVDLAVNNGVITDVDWGKAPTNVMNALVGKKLTGKGGNTQWFVSSYSSVYGKYDRRKAYKRFRKYGVPFLDAHKLAATNGSDTDLLCYLREHNMVASEEHNCEDTPDSPYGYMYMTDKYYLKNGSVLDLSMDW